MGCDAYAKVVVGWEVGAKAKELLLDEDGESILDGTVLIKDPMTEGPSRDGAFVLAMESPTWGGITEGLVVAEVPRSALDDEDLRSRIELVQLEAKFMNCILGKPSLLVVGYLSC